MKRAKASFAFGTSLPHGLSCNWVDERCVGRLQARAKASLPEPRRFLHCFMGSRRMKGVRGLVMGVFSCSLRSACFVDFGDGLG